MHRPPDREPVAHKLKAGAIDGSWSARVRFERLKYGGSTVAEIRALVPQAASIADAVSEIITDVASRGDTAVAEYTARFDESPAPHVRVPAAELSSALDAMSPDVRAGLEVAIANVASVGWGGAHEPRETTLPQGHRILVREVPVARAAVYVPGGQAPYPSTVVMGVVTARSAGVGEVVVCTPPPIAPVLLGACALAGVDEVYRVGGAQAIAALALRHRPDRTGRRDRRPRQSLRAGGEAPPQRPRWHRRLRRPERPVRHLRRR